MKNSIVTYQNPQNPIPDFLIINRHSKNGPIELPNGRHVSINFAQAVKDEKSNS